MSIIMRIKELFNSKVEFYHKITANEAKTIIDEKSDIKIIDVRTDEEYKRGHIKGSINIPNEIIASRIKEIIKDKNTKVFVYCQSGIRAKKASIKLVKLGYRNVYNFGGINAWKYDITK